MNDTENPEFEEHDDGTYTRRYGPKSSITLGTKFWDGTKRYEREHGLWKLVIFSRVISSLLKSWQENVEYASIQGNLGSSNPYSIIRVKGERIHLILMSLMATYYLLRVEAILLHTTKAIQPKAFQELLIRVPYHSQLLFPEPADTREPTC